MHLCDGDEHHFHPGSAVPEPVGPPVHARAGHDHARYPLVDTLRIFTLRLLQGRSPFSADRKHIHHRLLRLGMNHLQAALTIHTCTAVMVSLGSGCPRWTPRQPSSSCSERLSCCRPPVWAPRGRHPSRAPAAQAVMPETRQPAQWPFWAARFAPMWRTAPLLPSSVVWAPLSDRTRPCHRPSGHRPLCRTQAAPWASWCRLANWA